jgi:penicillin-binding protein 2
MIQNPEDRRPPLTPQLARRVAIIGGIALTMFAIIFFRLWFLQVLDGQTYLAQAQVNTLREVAIPAPRGDILDSSGALLVSSTQALDVQIEPPDLPVPVTTANMYPPRIPHADTVVYRRLAHVLGISDKPLRHGCKLAAPEPAGVVAPIKRYHLPEIQCLVATSVYQAPYANVTVKPDVIPDVEYFIAENQQNYRGVVVQRVYTRSYPYRDLAAQLFGTVGPLDTQEVGKNGLGIGEFKGLPAQSIVGQSGLEAEYNRYLQGVAGKQRIQINASNEFQKYLNVQEPVAGENLKLWLDTKLQNAGQNALQESMTQNDSPGGAFVAMNPQNGAIYGMGSLPTFNPNIFSGAKPVSQSVYDQLNNAASGYPLINRAIQSEGPTGSTFKPITATAALESGSWLVNDTFDDTGQFCFPGDPTDCLHNSGHAANGVLNLVNAIRVSDDVFFYNLGARMNDDVPQGGALQHWARLFGIGQPTGIDLPDEDTGTLPTPAWRANINKLEAECDDATGPFKGKPKHAPGGCGLAVYPPESWTIGDNVNVAVGQGDVQVTPLQLAIAYSAVANGGTIVTPHVGEDIQNAQGTVLQRIDPPPRRHLHIESLYLQTIREGLREAASAAGGTSADVMGNFPEQVYGKTGTAQYISNGVEQDYAWYACFVPASATSKPIVVVVWVEQGGFGDVAAAPVARQILSQWFFNKPGAYTAGTGSGNAL